jgi:threonine dehydratase
MKSPFAFHFYRKEKNCYLLFKIFKDLQMKTYFSLFFLLVIPAFVFGNDPFTKETFLQVQEDVKGHLVKTPLIPLPGLSNQLGKPAFLKDESCQKGRSFKSRGVTYEVFKTIENVILNEPEKLKKKLRLVTQTDGNHGVALIIAITSAIEKYSKAYPHLAKSIRKIEPVIFTYKNVLPIKRATMQEALKDYRKVASCSCKGQIFDDYVDYGDAKKGREKFIQDLKGQAIYMEHGGIKTMQGHAIATLEILDQLKEMGIENKRICLLLPIGAGGPIGLAAALKAFSPQSTAVMVQTPRWGAFNRSYISGKMEYNDPTLSPFTVEVLVEGVAKPVIYEDGISVDAPESIEAIHFGQKYLDDAIYADPKRALNESAPLLLRDAIDYYDSEEKAIIGGTTAIVSDAILYNPQSQPILEADLYVLFGTEGSIDPDIKEYTRLLLSN